MSLDTKHTGLTLVFQGVFHSLILFSENLLSCAKCAVMQPVLHTLIPRFLQIHPLWF